MDYSRTYLNHPGASSDTDRHSTMAELLHKEAFDLASADDLSKNHPVVLGAKLPYLPYEYERTTTSNRSTVGLTENLIKIIQAAEQNLSRLTLNLYKKRTADEEAVMALEGEAKRVTIALRALAFEWSEEDKKALGHTQIPLSTF